MSAAIDAPAAAGSLWERAGRWPGALIAVGILALTRVAQLVIMIWLGVHSEDGVTLRQWLLEWDGGWFVRVAENGYPTGYTFGADGALQANELAFFPLYPMLIRAGTVLGLDAGSSAIVVSWLAAAAAAVALYLLGTTLYDRRAGYMLVAICCSAPASVVLSMAYSEGLFLALVAGMFVAAHRRVWWAAGLLGLSAALTRPTGAAAAAGLAVAALLAIRTTSRGEPGSDPGSRPGGEPGGRPGRWQPIVAALVALAGLPAYLLWVALRVGDLDAWFRIQTAGWGTSFDFGASTVSFLNSTLSTGEGWIPVSVALILLAALVAAGVALAGRPWLPITVYGILAMVLVYGQAGFYHSKPRLLLPVLLTLLPAVLAAARARPRVAVLSIVAWAAFGLWYGAYLVVVWPYTL